MTETQSTNVRPSTSPPWAFWRWKLHWQILLGLLVGAGLGYLSARTALAAARHDPGPAAALRLLTERWDYLIYDLIGDLFMNGLKLIIVPLVTSSVVLAIIGIGSQSGFGRLGLKTLTYYLCTSLIAILVGLTLVDMIKPGSTESGQPLLTSQSVARFEAEKADLDQRVAGRTGTDFLDVFRKMVPDNPVTAAVEGNLLGLIVASMLFGFFATKIQGQARQVFTDLWQAIYDATLAITELVLRFAPLGVGMLVAATVAENYTRLSQEQRFDEFITGIVSFTLTALLALVLHFAVVLPLILLLLARVNPLRHYRAMAPALMTAFSTASSSATLPVTMECVERRAKVSNRTASFILPLGATVNMDGTALYECVAAIFIAQAFGVELSFGQQFFVVVVALLTSVGVAGVPTASLVAIVIILQSLQRQLEAQGVSVPLEAGLPILLVFDRFLDMCRTTVNIFSDSCGAVLIARSEGETQVLSADTADL